MRVQSSHVLSGKHENANMEVSDMDIYWTVLSQFKNKIGV